MSRCDGRWWRGGGGWASQTDAAQPVACLENVLDAGLMLLPSQLSNAVLIVYLSPSAVPHSGSACSRPSSGRMDR